MGLDAIKPPQTRRAAPMVLALLIWSALLVIAAGVYFSWPSPEPRAPFEILATRSSTTPTGNWRIEHDVNVRFDCETVVVERNFVPTDGANIVFVEPIKSYIEGAGAPRYAIDIQRGPLLAWHEYDLSGGSYRSHFWTIKAYECENGFSGEVVSGAEPVIGGSE